MSKRLFALLLGLMLPFLAVSPLAAQDTENDRRDSPFKLFHRSKDTNEQAHIEAEQATLYAQLAARFSPHCRPA